MPGPKPKLEVATPVTSNFPSEITSATSVNTATPLSSLSLPAFLCKAEPDFVKTPISPPLAYTDFLSKAMSLNSPIVAAAAETTPLEPLPATDASEKPDDSSISAPSTTGSNSAKDDQSVSASPTTSASAASTKPSSPATATTLSASEKASAVERALASASASASLVPPSPFTKAPMSAPLTGPTSFPSFQIPPSPALSNLDSPMSAVSSMFSPYSGRSSRPVFDWDAAIKKRTKTARTSVRHIREVVTRTVTYTPRMEPAPRGKRRKVE
ncbi:hypothetical protein A9K55_006668 [Cordyceps militaris]|uniref:Uncharacterized protein n=1 Tax=Cordyceps militaris TaxID=73501 RepID=A0A2H4SBZ5_CORMI|nr:hypothetical protein A9K55_006668 [Cordyceps militaris]